jgi:hypothetical protein
MFGTEYRNTFGYSTLVNLTDSEIAGRINDYDIWTIPPRSQGKSDILSWDKLYSYDLTGSGSTYQFDRTATELTASLSYTYLFPNQALKVEVPEVSYHGDEVGILGYNETSRVVDVYRTDQTTEHNEIKRVTVNPGQFFYVRVMKGQDFGFSDAVDTVDYQVPRRFYRSSFPYYTSVLQERVQKGAAGQGLELVLLGGGPVAEFPIVTASEDLDVVPSGFALHANHPNPFSKSTTIEYEIPKVSAVTIRVYDIMGRRVRTLVDVLASAGAASVGWDGRDDAGAPMASGTYIARLETSGFSASRMLVLAR